MSDTPDSEKGKTFAALVRLHEANCGIDFPAEEEQRFRVAIMRRIGRELNLREMKDLRIDGDAPGRPRPTAAAGR